MKGKETMNAESAIENQRQGLADKRGWQDIPKQRLLVENGEIGDCWRCCIAAVVGVPAEDVPHFVAQRSGSCDADTQAWLNERGFLMLHVEGDGRGGQGGSFPRWGGRPFPEPAVIACGPTQRSRGLGKHHAVVLVEGKIVYDPHPTDAGLTAIVERYFIFPVQKNDRSLPAAATEA